MFSHSHPSHNSMAGFPPSSSVSLFLFPFILERRYSPRNLSDSFGLLDFTFFMHWVFYYFPATKLLFIFLWFSSSGLLLFFFLSSYLCVAFSFCFSFLLPANDNQHTDGKPVPVSLSSLPSFSFQFPVWSRHTAWCQTTRHPFTAHPMSSPSCLL